MRADATVAVLTAAGRSQRMGTPKGLLDWEGMPLIAHQVRALAEFREVIVVLGHGADALRSSIPPLANVRVLEHLGYDAGRASTLLVAFQAISDAPAGILVVALDQPLVPSVLATMLDAFQPASPIAVPVCEGRRGHPILFRGDLLSDLRAIDEAGAGLRAVVERYRGARQEVRVDTPTIWLDLNDPAAYQSATGL